MEPETPGPVMAAKVVSHAIAATAGALLGGGAGAVAGAAFAPVLEEMLRRGDRAYADSVYRALEAASETADMSADEMAGAIRVHDRYLALSTATVQAALNTLNEQKVAGLSRALGDGLRDDALLDVSRLVVCALADMEAPHIRVLELIATELCPASPPEDGMLEPGRFRQKVADPAVSWDPRGVRHLASCLRDHYAHPCCAVSLSVPSSPPHRSRSSGSIRRPSTRWGSS